MSDQTHQIDAPAAPASLDASVDALMGQLDAASAVVRDAAAEAHRMAPESEIVDPPAGMMDSTITMPDSPDALLNEISADIEERTPAPPAAPTSAVAEVEVEDEIDQSAFEAPSEDELGVNEPASAAKHPGRGAEIDRLDAALAAGADRVLANVQADLDDAEQEQPPASASAVHAPAAIAATPAPAQKHAEPASPSKPISAVEAAAAPADSHQVETAAPEVKKRSLAEITASLLSPLRPIAALHEGLAEPTRQTIGYCAVITLFFASCVWGARLYRKPMGMEPVTVEHEFYDANTPAHGVTSPPKAEHGEEAKGGHEAVKKDEHGAPAKKASSGHGSSDAHAEKKPASKPKKGAKAPADAHGGH